MPRTPNLYDFPEEDPVSKNQEETPAEIIATLKNSGWTEKDLKAVPALADLLKQSKGR